MAVTKGKNDILAVLNDGFARVPPAERARVLRSWAEGKKSLDEDDDMTAGLFVDLLAETYDELKNVALPFCQYYLGTG